MKKVVVAFVAGAVLATAGSVYAEDIKSLVGQTKKIQAEVSVKVDGKKADKVGIIIDGTTYLPVRSIGNVLDMDVSYSKTEVELTSKGESTVEPTTETPSEPKPMTPEDIQTIKQSEEQISSIEQRIVREKQKVVDYEKEIKAEEEKLSTTTDKYEKELIQMKINGLNSNLSAAIDGIASDEKSIVDFKAYIAKIKAKYE